MWSQSRTSGSQKSKLQKDRGWTQKDFFSLSHNSVVLQAEFSIKDRNFSTQKLQVKKNAFQNEIFCEVGQIDISLSLISL